MELSCVGTITRDPPSRSFLPRKYLEWQNVGWWSRSCQVSFLSCHRQFLQHQLTPISRLLTQYSQGLCWHLQSNRNSLWNFSPKIKLYLHTLWKRILPRSGFGNVSPEMTSNRSISLSPLRKSSSILSIAVPALRKWLLHHAVNVWMNK